MFHFCSHARMQEELPFAILLATDNEVLARAANLLLARELFRVIVNVNFPDEIQLRQGARIIEKSTREERASPRRN